MCPRLLKVAASGRARLKDGECGSMSEANRHTTGWRQANAGIDLSSFSYAKAAFEGMFETDQHSHLQSVHRPDPQENVILCTSRV